MKEVEATLSDVHLAQLTPDMVDSIYRNGQYGPGAYAAAIDRVAPLGFDSSPFSFIPQALTAKNKIALFAATRAMVLNSINREMTRDDFARLLTDIYGVTGPQAQGMVERHLSFEDYDASNMLRSVASSLPSLTGGVATEVAASLFDMLDRITPDSLQQSQDYSLRRWRDFGQLLMSLPDDALLTTTVISPADAAAAAKSGDDGSSSHLTEFLLASSLGLVTTLLTRGKALPSLVRRGRTIFRGAKAAVAKGAAAVSKAVGGFPPLPGAPAGDYYDDEVGDLWSELDEDDDGLIVLAEAGDILVHPGVDWESDGLYDAAMRSEASNLLRLVLEKRAQLAQGKIEEGDFWSDIGQAVTPFISDALTVVGGAVGTLAGPLGSAAGAGLGKLAGDAIEGAIKPSTAVKPKRMHGSKQASRKLVKHLGQHAANIIDATRAPKVAHGTAGRRSTRELYKLFMSKGSNVRPSDVLRALGE